MVKNFVGKLKQKYKPSIIIANGENAASGKGITEKIYKGFLDDGVQVVTLGNHAWANREIFEFIDDAKSLIRPANYPEGTPGRGYTYVKVNDVEVAVINVMGLTFLEQLECPFRTIDRILEKVSKRTPFIFVDFHAEATSEKQAMGWYLDGRVSAVVGTHTHVQTADERILPNGTAFLTDVGMTGPYNGVLGVEKEAVLKKFVTKLPVRFEVATGSEQLSAVVIDLDTKTGRAISIERILINDDHPFQL